MRLKKAPKTSGERAVIGYVRASTDDQTITLDAQEARLRAYATSMNWEALEIVIDAGESAASLARPGIAAVLERVRVQNRRSQA